MSGLVRCYNVADMTNENNTDEKKKARLVAQEMVRLSELRLDVQQTEIAVMERKAALLGAFCFAVIGYLLAHNAELFWKWAAIESCLIPTFIAVIITKAIPSLVLARGMFFCWKTLTMGRYQWKGATLSVMADNPFRYDLTDILKGLAERYDEAVKRNSSLIRENKVKNIVKAINWGGCGVLCAFISVFLGEIALPFVAALYLDCSPGYFLGGGTSAPCSK